MRLKVVDIHHCVDKAREMAEQYRLYSRAGDDTMRSLDDFIWVCQQYLEKHIELLELQLNAEGRSIAAVYLLEGDRYQIFVLAGHPPEWARFVACKELFHVVLDEPGCRSTAIGVHLDEMEITFSIDDSQPKKPAAWEVLAEIAAMEFMLPYAQRLKIVAKRNGDEDLSAVANAFGVPQSLVEQYCSSATMEALKAFHRA